MSSIAFQPTPDSDLTELTTVSRGSVAAQWANNISQDRHNRVRSSGNVVIRDAMAKRVKEARHVSSHGLYRRERRHIMG